MGLYVSALPNDAFKTTESNRLEPSKRAIRPLHAQARLCNISDAVTSRQLHAPSELVVERLQH